MRMIQYSIGLRFEKSDDSILDLNVQLGPKLINWYARSAWSGQKLWGKPSVVQNSPVLCPRSHLTVRDDRRAEAKLICVHHL